MSTSRRARPTLAATALLAFALWPAPAQAADEIGLSLDGVTWGSELAVPLFDSARRWVPGDDEARRFQVRNDGPTAASMTVEALDPGGDRVLAADLAVAVRVDGGPWTVLDVAAGPRAVTVAPLGVGRAVPVELRAAFDPASGNPTQNHSTPLALRITLAGDVATEVGPDGAGVTDDVVTDRGGQLPGTGATVAPELLLAALTFCVAGALVIARRSSEDRRPGVDR